MSHPYTDELRVGLEAVRIAARICQAVQATITPDVLDKKDDSPVTIADFASQAVICQAIGNSFGQDPIIAEEDSLALQQPQNIKFLTQIQELIRTHFQSAATEEICQWIDRGGAKDYSRRFWTLDPIDGTKGFLRRDQFAVSLALIVEGQIELGILACPNLGSRTSGGHSMFHAVRGHGAFAGSLDPETIWQPIRVTSSTSFAAARLCESLESGHSSHSEAETIAMRLGIENPSVRMDSQAKYAVVASGEADIYLRLPTKTGYFEKIWDHAGGVAIVEEAGGRVTDIAGSPLDFTQGFELRKNRGVIVTNGALHDAVVDAVQSVVTKSSE